MKSPRSASVSRETPEHRSRIMRAVSSKATAAELAVRKYLRQFGLRMRYNVLTLPGKPDIVIYSARTAILVHGCFWHGHSCKRGARTPKTNTNYWIAKVAGNRARDRRNASALRKAGWKVVTIWECESERAKARKLKAIAAHAPGASLPDHAAAR